MRASAAVVLAGPLAACGVLRPEDGSGLSVLGTATPTATPATPMPTMPPYDAVLGGPGATPSPPEVTLDPAQVGQGETTVVTVRQRGAASGSARLLGQRIPLIAEGGGMLWCVAGAGLDEPLGAATLMVVTRDASGNVLSETEQPFEVVPVERPVDYLQAAPEVTAVLTPEASEIEAALRAYEQFNLFQAQPLWDGKLRYPVDDFFVTTEFGQGRSINGGPVTGQHAGVDLANDSGTPILAPAVGRVAWTGEMPIRGNSVLLDHGAGVVTGYHHLLEWEVEVGQMVVTGQEIAKMGSTGFSTGPHLHWEMTIYGVNVDPTRWVDRVFLPRA